jgi:hypothetical protein
MQPIRRLVAAGAALLVAPFVTAISLAAPAQALTTPAAPVHAAAAAASAGATVPFTEYLAATQGATNGTVLPVDYNLGTLQSEATGRQAVELIGQGQYVSFTLTTAANAVDFHYSIPDSLSGGGLTEPLDLYVGNTLTKTLSLTSQYAWLYGSQATVTNTPTVGEADTMVPHDFFADVRYQFSSTLPAGTVVKLQVDAGDNSPWYAVNTADFYNVAAAIGQPANSINVTQSPYNADATGANDSTQALQNAINAASSSGQTVYIPQGTYTISNPLNVNNVTVEGAGEWYTTLTGSNVEFAGNGSNINISNLAIFGNVNTRVDSDGSVNGFNGTFSSSTINDVWIQNTKVGAWILGPTNGLTIENVQIQDTTADGVNFNAAAGAITNSTVENSFIRNTQDDGLAMWAENSGDTNDTFTQNTVNSPGVANNVALYGDTAGAQVTNNLLQDTVTRGGGIGIGQRFSSTAVAGTSTISGNELIRTGQYDPGWNYGVGAIWFWPQQGNMNATYNVTGNTILNSPYEAFQFQNENMYDGSATDTAPSAGYDVTGVTISSNTVTNVGTFVFQDQAPGSIEVDNTTATGVGVAGQFVCGSGFTITQGSGNSGWSGTTCGMPGSWPVWAYPGVTTFENATVGQATSTQRIAIMNTGAAATTLGAISASSGFTVSQDPSDPCGTSLAATVPGNTSVWCAVDVSFTAPASGITTGTLTIPSGEPGSPTTVQLIGSTGGSSVNNPPTVTPGALAFGYETVGSTTAAQSVTVHNPGASAIAISSVAVSGPFAETNTCGSSLAAGASCTASVTFTPTTGGAATGALAITNSATATPIGASLSGTGLTSTTNLALGATLSASSTDSGFPASNANDGNTSSYWESNDGSAYPQTLTANLGQSMALGSVTLDLPPSSAWSTRTETLSVLGSTNGTSWTTLVPSAGYTFNPSTGNTVSFNLPSGTSDQYLELVLHRQHRLDRGPGQRVRDLPGHVVLGRHRHHQRDPDGLPDLAVLRQRDHRRHVGGADGDGQEHRHRGGDDQLGRDRHRVRADEHLRQLPGRGRLVHRERHLRPDGGPGLLGQPDGQQQRDQRHPDGPADRHRHRFDDDQPGAQQVDHRVQLHPDLRARERQRRQREHVLGVGERVLAGHAHREPGLVPDARQHGHRPAAGDRLVHPDPDALGARLEQRQLVDDDRGVRDVHLEPEHGQHRDDQLPGRYLVPVRAVVLHGEQRAERRPGLGVAGLRLRLRVCS